VCHFNFFKRGHGDESIQEEIEHIPAEFAAVTFSVEDGLLPEFAHALVKPSFAAPGDS
jgi:hypothetical protein